MTGPAFQVQKDIVRGQDGRHHVRLVLQLGPLATVLILPPDATELLLADLAGDDGLPALIAEARRLDTMGNFQVVTDMPTLPPLFGGLDGRKN